MKPEIQKKFFNKLPEYRQDFELFEYLPDVYFFLKDLDGRFIDANQLLIDKLGLGHKEKLIGKTDFDLFPKYLAEAYQKHDLEIIRTGKPLINHVELLLDYKKSIEWIITTKLPVYGTNSQIIGVKGITRDYHKMDQAIAPYKEISEAISYINDNYHRQIKVENLAQLSHQSISTFVRAFKRFFNTTPIKYINKLRVEIACQQLIDTDHSISQIAQDTGFSDQSHLCREFSKIIGITPLNYRKGIQ